VGNAADAIRPLDEKWIRIEVSELDEGYCIDIQDSGLGLSEEEVDKVFTPFFTTKPVGEGTGLGLSISSSIAASHGGSLRVLAERGAYLLSSPYALPGVRAS
jgi:two-component system, NtrC family, sensor kinase